MLRPSMRTHSMLAGLVLLTALLSACSDDANDETGVVDAGQVEDAGERGGSVLDEVADGEPVPQAKFLSALAQVTCAQLMACCQAEGVELSAAECDMNVGAGVALKLAALDDKKVSYDPAVAGSCLKEAIAAANSGECSSELGSGSVGCESAYTGLQQPGEACDSDLECAVEQAGDVASCERKSDGTSACVVLQRASEGDWCFETCEQTTSGVACTRIVATSAGTKPRDVRGRCFFEDGLYCSTDGKEPACAKVRAHGDDCSVDEECGIDHFCEPSKHTCAARTATDEAPGDSLPSAVKSLCQNAAGGS